MGFPLIAFDPKSLCLHQSSLLCQVAGSQPDQPVFHLWLQGCLILALFRGFRFQWGSSPSFLPESWTKHPSVVLVKTTHQMMAHVPYEGRAYGPPQHAVAIVAELVHLPETCRSCGFEALNLRLNGWVEGTIVRNLLFFHGKSHAFSLSIFPELQCKTCGSQPQTHWP